MANWIGTSGWSYDHWDGVLYPPGLPTAKRLAVYVERYDTVELNSSYYHWPRETTFGGWRERLPEGFLLTVKAPKSLTHVRKLDAPEAWTGIIARDMAHLGDKRGPFLVQLPPSMECDPERLETLLSLLPGWLRVAVEFRHPTWHVDEVYGLLERCGAAYCIMSGAGLPCILRATADFVYVRLHGPDSRHLYAGSYRDDDLRWWSDRIREWDAQGRDVFAYFNNDGHGNAVRNADRLKEFLGE